MLPSAKNFDIVFIKRTKELLSNYQGDLDFTMLVNSLIGLIMVPNEVKIKNSKEFSFDFYTHSLDTFRPIKEIISGANVRLYNEVGKEYEQRKFFYKTKLGELPLNAILLGDFIRRIRNGIAHFGFTPVIADKKWIGLIIRNHNKSNELNMEIYFTQQELKKFAELIADKYIQNAEKE